MSVIQARFVVLINVSGGTHIRAGATDFGLEGQLVQKKGPWRKGPFLK